MNDDPLSVAMGLRELILAHRSETESGRQLAEPIVERLVATRLCRLALPTRDGGLEVPPSETLEVFETLAAAEASVAWVVWNNSLICWFARFMVPQARAQVFGNPTSMFASSTRPMGKAEVLGDQYRINGRWNLVSGCMHADSILLMCLVTEGGSLRLVAEGVPEMRMFIFPRDECEIIDTWYTGGLRGTGSHDVQLHNAVGTRAFSIALSDTSGLPSPFGAIPILVTMSAGCASICLGLAQAAADALVELGRTKISPDPNPDLRDRSTTQAMVARNAATLEGMRCAVRSSYETLWREVGARGSARHETLACSWRASVAAALACREIINEMHAAGGTSALYVDNPIERIHRDVHAVCQHISVQPLWLEEAGRVMLGLTPSQLLFAL